ncbi:D-arabinono-1,4-lactone oxidase [Pseudonocardia sp. WMMC193]|uniref:D-arabinono-1,4-lactone oxidase n=1 Tax=Pseudonocardia sp. WMMC193 TaxID=2911965 RepID=UPI001F234779|nr:D-arabinono-1,4-lactone oxidase [Pseudonocardia sp. WMMC193]MCF7551986.1 FAD-binding protein [Pseudonocardia sp. WMMC193]
MWTNWSGGQSCRPQRTDRPLDEAGVVAAVRRAAERGLAVRPVGSGYSESTLSLTGDVHLDCSALTGVVDLADDVVRVRAGARLTEVHAALAEHGRALATVPHGPGATVGGAIGTGTHGGSRQVGSLSAQVVGARFVDGTGTLRRAEDADLDALRCHLGALGVLTEVSLRTVAATLVDGHEEVVDPAEASAPGGPLDTRPWAALQVHLPSGEALLRWAGPAEQRDPVPEATGPVDAIGRVVTRLGHSASAQLSAQWSAQRSRPAPRWEGVPTAAPYVLLPTPDPARETSTEWAVPREALTTALRELHSATTTRELEIRRPVEVRVGPAETGWLHPAFGRATGWIAVRSPRGADDGPLFRLVGSVLEGMGGRPHWAGRHDWTAADLAVAYPRLPDFRAVRDRLDPDRRFAGAHMQALLGP